MGDAEPYLGQKAGIAELRLGLIFPAGYDNRDGDPWIGPGNEKYFSANSIASQL